MVYPTLASKSGPGTGMHGARTRAEPRGDGDDFSARNHATLDLKGAGREGG